jgi:predicted secreted protein
MSRSKSWLMGSAALFALLFTAMWPARAAEPTDVPRTNLLSFSSSATVEVAKDWLTINLSATRDGTDAQAVQSQLKQVLDVALAEARRAAQPGALEVKTGYFNVLPRYGKEGRISGWQGSAELVLEGRDIARVAAIASKLVGMVVTGSNYSLSRELREKVDADLVAQAIAKFRQRAGEMARQFGFAGYALREVSVQGAEQDSGPPVLFETLRAAVPMAADAALPVPTEPGKGVLTATVQGNVQLTP